MKPRPTDEEINEELERLEKETNDDPDYQIFYCRVCGWPFGSYEYQEEFCDDDCRDEYDEDPGAY